MEFPVTMSQWNSLWHHQGFFKRRMIQRDNSPASSPLILIWHPVTHLFVFPLPVCFNYWLPGTFCAYKHFFYLNYLWMNLTVLHVNLFHRWTCLCCWHEELVIMCYWAMTGRMCVCCNISVFPHPWHELQMCMLSQYHHQLEVACCPVAPPYLYI